MALNMVENIVDRRSTRTVGRRRVDRRAHHPLRERAERAAEAAAIARGERIVSAKPKLGIRDYLNILRLVFLESDTTPLRLMLALGSLGWTIGLWLPLHTFDRPVFAWMRFAAGEWIWGAAFLLHFIGVTCRMLDTKERIHWAVAINAWGLFVWLMSTLAQTASVGEYSPAMALEWVACAAAFVSLLRTGMNEEITSA